MSRTVKNVPKESIPRPVAKWVEFVQRKTNFKTGNPSHHHLHHHFDICWKYLWWLYLTGKSVTKLHHQSGALKRSYKNGFDLRRRMIGGGGGSSGHFFQGYTYTRVHIGKDDDRVSTQLGNGFQTTLLLLSSVCRIMEMSHAGTVRATTHVVCIWYT